MRCFLLNRLIKIIVLPLLSILNLNAQDELNIQNEEFMPLHTRILWGEKGLIRKMNLAPETRRAELKLRTKMLQNHQKLAMVSLGLLAYQYSLGQQVIDSGFAPKYTSAHRKYSTVTWGFYMTSASLSYFAPPALVYEKRVSSMKIHRWLSYIHFAGMIALPVLGKNISKSGYELSATNLHQDVATVTFVSMILSGLLTILPY